MYFGKNGKLGGIVCSHVYDELGCGNKEFDEKVWNKLDETLCVGSIVKDNFRYLGLNIKKNLIKVLLLINNTILNAYV